MKHPKRKIRRLKFRIRELKAVRAELWRTIAETNRALDQLDGGDPERQVWTLAHRIHVYRMEQRLRPKANETGKVQNFVCAPGIRVRWDQSAIGEPPSELHTHSVYPDKTELRGVTA